MLRFALYLVLTGVVVLIAGAAGGVYLFHSYGRALPDYEQLADYDPPTVTRVHAGDGRLIAEFAIEKRVFVPLTAIPKRVIDVFIAAEDQNFFQHPGVDVTSVLRAALTNLRGLGDNRRPVGGSTITQQVAKNFLLSGEVSITRKIKEAILAFRIERALSKERILELYLNEIYLGYGSYGVAAAALNYFDKSLDELTLAEAAYLAALPKAPLNYDPVRKAQAARERRDWVVERMVEEGFATRAAGQLAKQDALRTRPRGATEIVRADYFTEEVRREILARFGQAALYEGGLSARTSLDPTLQDIGHRTLRAGLEAYDRRHGWRGPIKRIAVDRLWQSRLAELARPEALGSWTLAVVLDVGERGASIGLADGRQGVIPLSELTWAREARDDRKVGPSVRHPKDVLAAGDVVAVEPRAEGGPGEFALRQIPSVNGALVALDPHTGRILAMVGGYDFAESQYNRAVQAKRQPGSAFKPFIYTAALENGFTPSSLVLDAPIVIDQGPGLPKWKPGNYSNEFYGPSTLRVGIEKSRNLMTVRLARSVGMDKVVDYARRFGVVDDMPPMLSMALGAADTTLLRMVAGYAILVNGGQRIVPSLIDRIQDRRGATIYRHDDRPCPDCRGVAWQLQPEPEISDNRPRVIQPESAYQMVSIMEGVVQRGTAIRIKALNKRIAGKTGTTNDFFDAWFIGFTADLVVGVYVGFDNPQTLGSGETGSSIAVPIFRDFMAEALADRPDIPFRIPSGVRMVRVDAATGAQARPGDDHVILEAFRPGTEPTSTMRAVLDADDASEPGSDNGLPSPTGGLY